MLEDSMKFCELTKEFFYIIVLRLTRKNFIFNRYISSNPPDRNVNVKYNGITHHMVRGKVFETRYYSKYSWPEASYFKLPLVHTIYQS